MAIAIEEIPELFTEEQAKPLIRDIPNTQGYCSARKICKRQGCNPFWDDCAEYLNPGFRERLKQRGLI